MKTTINNRIEEVKKNNQFEIPKISDTCIVELQAIFKLKGINFDRVKDWKEGKYCKGTTNYCRVSVSKFKNGENYRLIDISKKAINKVLDKIGLKIAKNFPYYSDGYKNSKAKYFWIIDKNTSQINFEFRYPTP